jgi:hypothetical protein
MPASLQAIGQVDQVADLPEQPDGFVQLRGARRDPALSDG